MTVKDYLTKEEISSLLEKNDLRAAWEVAQTWLWIAGAFALAGFFPNVLTIIIALFILGGKQLGCAIIMHDASHRSLFNSRKLNDWVGNWLGGYPILHDADRYRPYHLKHHTVTGTADDPDLNLTLGYPARVASMVRKIARDFSGATGVKGYFGVILMHIGVLEYTLGGTIARDKEKLGFFNRLKRSISQLWGPIFSNLVLFGILWLCGAPWLYLLWVGAILTTFQFSLRVRSIAEHSVVPNQLDPMQNTRTTYASWWERILFAPHYVNYHAEHHLLMTVPCYNLPHMHKLLLERGFYKSGVLAVNYWAVLKKAVIR